MSGKNPTRSNKVSRASVTGGGRMAKVAGGQAGAAPQPLEPPRPLQVAVRLMYAGAALTVLGTAADVIDLSVSGAAGLRTGHPHATAAQVHATMGALITSIVFSGLIEAALWFLMARANRSGAGWARIAASTLFGVSTVLLLTGFLGTAPVTSKAFTALTWLVGLATVWFLWQRESSAYFNAPAAPVAPNRSPAPASRPAAPSRSSGVSRRPPASAKVAASAGERASTPPTRAGAPAAAGERAPAPPTPADASATAAPTPAGEPAPAPPAAPSDSG